jgi:hypothetical protein
MPITDARAIKYSNEVLRPLAEKLRDVNEDIARAEQQWLDEVGALMPNTADVLEDGRDAEGVSRLTGAEINSLRAIFVQMKNFRAGSAVTPLANVDTRIGRACVRTLRS